MAAPVIDVSQLAKHFGDITAVDGLSFTVAAGTIAGLLGGNGAGKTTTIAILCGLVVPSAGRVRVFGEDVVRRRHRVLPRMNFSSPYVDLPHRLTVGENLEIYGRLYGVADVGERIRDLAADLQFADLLARPTGRLSSGQRTRVALAKALLNTPELLLLDEPTASMDPDTADFIRAYLAAYRDRHGATILLASHNMTEVERLADDVIMMAAGRKAAQGSPAALRAAYGRASLEEVFLDIARGPALPAREEAAQ
ncbi:MAG: ABC transporter ATP-binding protein [Alphaproteobacteria bacterium]|nr:ABC transporter ATP-binding protein [Alphaproteobacteria bacterium]